jgi:hypothetical protein
MPRIPTLPPALRFFGRIDRFTCECPRCAQLLRAHFDQESVAHVRRAEAGKRRPSPSGTMRKPAAVQVYNPLTQRLTCTRCRRVWAVGLVLYPVHPRSQAQQPYDTRPTWKQLLELRQLSTAAYFVDHPIKGRDSVNLAIEGTCICRDGRMDPVCPIHGWEEQLGPKSPVALAELEKQAEAPTLGPPRDRSTDKPHSERDRRPENLALAQELGFVKPKQNPFGKP